MLHIVPILCLIFFIFMVEYRFKRHIDDIDKEIQIIESKLKSLEFNNNIIINSVASIEKKVDESSSAI